MSRPVDVRGCRRRRHTRDGSQTASSIHRESCPRSWNPGRCPRCPCPVQHTRRLEPGSGRPSRTSPHPEPALPRTQKFERGCSSSTATLRCVVQVCSATQAGHTRANRPAVGVGHRVRSVADGKGDSPVESGHPYRSAPIPRRGLDTVPVSACPTQSLPCTARPPVCSYAGMQLLFRLSQSTL